VKRLACALAGSALALPAAGCGDSATASSGAAEPLRVTNGQFFAGDFPAPDGGPDIATPDTFRTSEIPAGFTGKKIGGLSPDNSLSVALALRGLSHGYWIVPMGVPDALTDNLTWQAVMDFSRTIPAGDQFLHLAAADRSGRFGAPKELHLTMLPLTPAGHVVASLSWGNNADLDLHLTGPSGKELDPKHPNSGELIDAGADAGLPLPGSGLLDRDSNAGCVSDGYRSENVVWDAEAGAPKPGTYLVRVDMFNACGVPAADFVFDLYIDGQPQPDQHRVGRLLDTDADGGGPGSGLFVSEFTLD
jgi:hypothetical protein